MPDTTTRLSPSPVRRLPAASGGGGRRGSGRARANSQGRSDPTPRPAAGSAVPAPDGRGAAAEDELSQAAASATAHSPTAESKESSEHSGSARGSAGEVDPVETDAAFRPFREAVTREISAIHSEQIDLLYACFLNDPNIAHEFKPYIQFLEGSDSSAHPLASYEITAERDALDRTPVQHEKMKTFNKLLEQLSPATIAAVSAAFAESGGQITAKVLNEIDKLVAPTFKEGGFSLSQILQGTTTHILVDVYGVKPFASARGSNVSTASMLARHQEITAITASIVPRHKSSKYVVLPPGGPLNDFNDDTPYRVLLEPLIPSLRTPSRGFNDYTAVRMVQEKLIDSHLSFRLGVLSLAHKILFKIFQLLVANCTLPELAPKLRTLTTVFEQMERNLPLHIHHHQVPSAFDFLMIRLNQFGPAGTTAFLEIHKALQRGTNTVDLSKVVAVLSFKIRDDELLSQSAMSLLTLHSDASAAMGADKFGFVPNARQLLEIYRAALDVVPFVGLPNQQVYAALLDDLSREHFPDMPSLIQRLHHLEETKQLSSITPLAPAAQDGPSASFSAAGAAATPAPATVLAVDGAKKARHKDKKKGQDKTAATASAKAIVPPPPPPRPPAQSAASTTQQHARHQKKKPDPAPPPAPAAPQDRQKKPTVAEAFEEVTEAWCSLGYVSTLLSFVSKAKLCSEPLHQTK